MGPEVRPRAWHFLPSGPALRALTLAGVLLRTHSGPPESEPHERGSCLEKKWPHARLLSPSPPSRGRWMTPKIHGYLRHPRLPHVKEDGGKRGRPRAVHTATRIRCPQRARAAFPPNAAPRRSRTSLTPPWLPIACRAFFNPTGQIPVAAQSISDSRDSFLNFQLRERSSWATR